MHASIVCDEKVCNDRFLVSSQVTPSHHKYTIAEEFFDGFKSAHTVMQDVLNM